MDEIASGISRDLQLKEKILEERSFEFQDAWKVLLRQFPHLQEFCGGLASIFPNTATVESDFSRLAFEKSEPRANLSDVALEGILHTKQYDALKELSSLDPNITSEEPVST